MATTLEALEQRIRRIEDIEAIRQLRMRYHININERRFDQMAGLFTADALVDFGPISRARGTAEIRELFLKIPRNADLVKQFIHNHVVEVDGDAATGISYLDARYAAKGESLMVAARFDEKYARQADGWRISEMVVDIAFSVPLATGWGGEDLNFIKPWR